MGRPIFLDIYWKCVSFLLIVPFSCSQESHTIILYNQCNHYYMYHYDTKYNGAVAGVVIGSFISAIYITVIIVICIKHDNKTSGIRGQVIHPHLKTISTSITFNQSYTTTFQEPPPYQQIADSCSLAPPYPGNSVLDSNTRTLSDTNQPSPRYQK